VIVTSATIDPERFARHFGEVLPGREVRPAPVIEVSGRMYPVEVRYRAPVAEGSKEGRAGSPPQDLEEFDLERRCCGGR